MSRARLSRAQILGLAELRREDVDVPEWNATVTIRELTGAERDEYETWMLKARAAEGGFPPNVRARLVVMCALDEGGQPLFAEADVTALGAKSGRALDRLWNAARRLSGMGGEAEAEAVGNSAAPSGGGG